MRSSAPEARELFFREPRRTEYEKGVFKLQDDTQTADDMERAVADRDYLNQLLSEYKNKTREEGLSQNSILFCPS